MIIPQYMTRTTYISPKGTVIIIGRYKGEDSVKTFQKYSFDRSVAGGYPADVSAKEFGID